MKLALDLDGALGDTRPLWDAWVADAGARLGLAGLPADRAAAAALLDGSAGNWRTLLERFAEDHAPAYLRRDAATSAALQSLASGGLELGVFTDAPEQLACVALAQLGAARRISRLECGAGALERILAVLGPDAAVVRTRNDLLQRP